MASVDAGDVHSRVDYSFDRFWFARCGSEGTNDLATNEGKSHILRIEGLVKRETG
jgi:hypothetical protein